MFNGAQVNSRARVLGAIGTAIVVATTVTACATSQPATHDTTRATTLAGSKTATVSIDNSSKASVSKAYRDVLEPALAQSIGWTGSVASCTSGGIGATAQAATLAAVNYMRSMAGLDSVSFSSANSAKAQKAALVYQAQGDLTHDIPKNWPCYSADAKEAGSKSNIAIGVGGASAIPVYMQEPGGDNALAGHRRWILFPSTTVMGSGSTTDSNALWVIGKQAKASSFANPSWVSWPTGGYFPAPLEPDGRWSLSGDSTQNYSFARASVTVTSSSGKRLKVTLHGQHASETYGSDTLVWQVSGLHATGNYVVKVTGIKRGSKTVSHSYTVKLFAPAP